MRKLPYKIKCWIPVEVEPEVEEVYETEDEAADHLEIVSMMQEENRYEIVECDEDGMEIS